MHDADDFHPIGNLSVQDEVAPHHEIPQRRGQVGPGGTDFRVCGEEQERRLDAVEKPVCRLRVVAGDVEPDLNQVVLGAGRAYVRSASALSI